MTNGEVTENKGKDPSRSDNGVYVQRTCGHCGGPLSFAGTYHTRDGELRPFYGHVSAEAYERCIMLPDLSPSPISPSDANQTPTDSIVRDAKGES